MESVNQNFYKRDLLLSGLGFLAIGILLFSTNPSTMPAVLLLTLPIFVAYTTFVASKLLLELLTSYSQRRIKFLSAILATCPTLVVVLGSLGQLGIQDIVLAVALLTGLSWYMKRQGIFA